MIAAATKRVGVEVIPVKITASKVEITSNKSPSLSARGDVGKKSTELSTASGRRLGVSIDNRKLQRTLWSLKSEASDMALHNLLPDGRLSRKSVMQGKPY